MPIDIYNVKIEVDRSIFRIITLEMQVVMKGYYFQLSPVSSVLSRTPGLLMHVAAMNSNKT